MECVKTSNNICQLTEAMSPRGDRSLLDFSQRFHAGINNISYGLQDSRRFAGQPGFAHVACIFMKCRIQFGTYETAGT